MQWMDARRQSVAWLELEGKNSMRRPPRISLLHATYRRVGGPSEVRDGWLGKAINPDAIEYVLSMDADDLATIALTEGVPRLVNPARGGEVTAVRNWNAAAAAATGDLLVVIADDLFPPEGWDRTLVEMLGDLDPARTPFVVKVTDSHSGRLRIRHPVISRAFYAKFGLFSSAYQGVYCDDDFTARAYWRSVVLDGRALELEHRRFPRSESHGRLNAAEEMQRGKDEYLAAWSTRKRTAVMRPVSTASPRSLTHWRLLVAQRRVRTYSNLHYVARPLWLAAQASIGRIRRLRHA